MTDAQLTELVENAIREWLKGDPTMTNLIKIIVAKAVKPAMESASINVKTT